MDRLRSLNVISGLGNRLKIDRPKLEFIIESFDRDYSQFEASVCEYADASEIFHLIEDLRLDGPKKPQTADPVRSIERPAGYDSADPPRGRPIAKSSLEMGQSYRARIASLKPFGAFATLLGVTPKTQGLIHISQLANYPVDTPKSVVQVGQVVVVTILSIQGAKIGLSMRKDPAKPASQRLTSPERFEIRQLIAAGVYAAKDFPDLDAPNAQQEAEENLDIEIRSDLPTFLRMEQPVVSQSPVEPSEPIPSFIPKPQGNLAKAIATTQSTERKPLPREVPKPWLDSAVGKRHKQPVSQQRRDLPVYQYKSQLLRAFEQNQVIIVQGDTGSGKTTQIAQYLYEAGYGSDKIIACTQPRRVAAVSIAQRVAEEMNVKVGDLVGYSIRFENITGPRTHIKYMTDGILQQEIVSDPQLSNYSVVILDEAHERTIATDVLFALLKKARTSRPDLKIIITSATLDATKFSEYFGSCPVYKIPGRTFPVDIQYSQSPEFDYIEAALFTTMQIHMSQPDGDILVFLTGQEEIDNCCEAMYKRAKDLEHIMATKLMVLPVYSALPSEVQSRIFEPTPTGYRKVIFATNIAETSITIDGIRYVVDPGVVKVNVYNSEAGMDVLKVVPISRAQAAQRAGRAGRTAPGKCYRLYTEDTYNHEMLAETIPEIQRHELSSTILLLKVMGIDDIFKFDFMDRPTTPGIFAALQELYQLGALDAKGVLTSSGRVIAKFPMSPSMAQVLLQSVRKCCAHEVLTIMSMLNLTSVFIRPSDPKKLQEADRARRKFKDPSGDHLTLLNIYDAWAQSGYSKVWCNDHSIHERSMRRAQHIRQQLSGILTQLKLRILSCQRDRDLVLKVLCSGYFRNVAKITGDGYKTLTRDTDVSIHPQSVLFDKKPRYVLYHSLIMTSKEYMHCVSIVQPAWLVEYAPSFFQNTSAKRKREETLAPMLKRHENGDDWRISNQKKMVKYESHRF